MRTKGSEPPEKMKRANLVMPVEVFNKARGRAVSEGSHLSAAITALLRLWLADKIELPASELARATRKRGANKEKPAKPTR
jgi:hypothetical protein